MTSSLPPRRILVTHASADAFAPHTRTMLGRIGYSILTESEFSETQRGRAGELPDLRLVDERRIGEVPEIEATPMIVLTGRQGASGADTRVAGALKRPAGLHETYRLLQQVLEDTPRTAPRIPTHLPAHLSRRDEVWSGTVLSLSENGCLLRSSEPLALGLRMRIRFHLPPQRTLEVEAESCYQLLPDTGLLFVGLTPDDREGIERFVERNLAFA